MTDFFNKAVSFGIGLVAQSKEQIEKTVDELVKKGEITRQESAGLTDELVKKGQEARDKLESFVQERVQRIIGEKNWVSRAEYDLLVKRVEQLEAKSGAGDAHSGEQQEQ